jgi:hypothetical protein
MYSLKRWATPQLQGKRLVTARRSLLCLAAALCLCMTSYGLLRTSFYTFLDLHSSRTASQQGPAREVVASVPGSDVWSSIVQQELKFWRNRSFSITDSIALLPQIHMSGAFHVTPDGDVRHVAGSHSDWHFNCFVDKLLRPAARQAKVDTYIFVHGWDEPVGRENEEVCIAKYGAQHANLWNPHVRSHLLPFLVNGKITGCHTDILIPQERLCEDGVAATQRSPFNWSIKMNKALWRGSSTGFGTPLTNHRVRLVRALINDSSIDIGLSAVTQGMMIEPSLLKPAVETKDWSKYKYLIQLDGNSYAGRIMPIAASNSALIAASIFDDIILRSLVHEKHYLRVSVDPGSITDAVRWLQTHDTEAKEMADAMTAHFFSTFAIPNLINYTTLLLREYASAIHFY